MKQHKASYWVFFSIRWNQAWKHANSLVIKFSDSRVRKPLKPNCLILSWESGTIYFSFMNNENLKKYITLNHVLLQEEKSSWNTSLWFYHELTSTTSCQQLGFSLIKEAREGWGIFVCFSPSCLPFFSLVLKIWYVAVWRTLYLPLSFLLCPSHFPPLQHDINQYLPNDCTHVDCFLNTKTWVPQLGLSQVDSVQQCLDGRGHFVPSILKTCRNSQNMHPLIYML